MLVDPINVHVEFNNRSSATAAAWLFSALIMTSCTHPSDPANLPVPEIMILPAEHEPVDEVIFAWDTSVELETFFAELVSLASTSAHVSVLLTREQSGEWISDVLAEFGADLSNIQFVHADVESVWVRDYGPLVVRKGTKQRVVDAKYFGGLGDDQVPKFMAETQWGLPRVELPLEIEGGNIQSDGTGLCLITEIALQDNRDRLAVTDIHELLYRTLGCRETLVLDSLLGEPTGHVDMFATITGPGEAIVGEIFEENEENAIILDENAIRLEQAGFKVRRIPMPSHADGLYRSYTNSLAVNDIVFVPVYPEDDRFEKTALETFAKAYPGRSIVPINASEIIKIFGAVHCVGMTVAR